jgi:hypothetical protein
MKPGIYFENIWFENDAVELKITVENTESRFINRVNVSYMRDRL